MTKKNPKVIACVIVRLNSIRLPRKALADLAGKPMLLQLIDRLKTAHSVTQIVVCTSNLPEDAPLLELAKDWGVEAFAGHELDVLSRLIAVAESMDADAVLRITGDNPFTDAENIDRMVEHHFAKSAEYTRTNHLPLGVTAEVMAPAMMRKLHNVMPDPDQSEYMSFFSFNPRLFRCEVLYPPPELDRPYYSLTIDYPKDLDVASSIYRKLANKSAIPSLLDVVKLMDGDRDFNEVSPNFPIKKPGGETITYEALIAELDALALKSRQGEESRTVQSTAHRSTY